MKPEERPSAAADTEFTPREIEVCRDLLAQIPLLTQAADALAPAAEKPAASLPAADSWPFDPFSYARRPASEIALAPGIRCGGEQTLRVVVPRAAWEKIIPRLHPRADVRPEAVYEDLEVLEVDPQTDFAVNAASQLITVKDGVPLPPIAAFRLLAAQLKPRLPQPDSPQRLPEL